MKNCALVVAVALCFAGVAWADEWVEWEAEDGSWPDSVTYPATMYFEGDSAAIDTIRGCHVITV